MTLILYRLLLLLLTPVLVLVLIIRSWSQPAYRKRINERLGWYGNQLKTSDVVIHGSSVGEILALKPLINQLLTQDKVSLTLTCFTPTGSAQIQQSFNHSVQHCYLPLDNIIAVKHFLSQIQPKLLVIMETELWPELIQQAKQRGIKLLLVNARLSTKSVSRYQKLSALVKPTLKCFDAILTQSKDNTANFIAIGAPKANTTSVGNLKYDLSPSADTVKKVETIKCQAGSNHRFWVVGSTHADDESLIFEAFAELKKQFADLVLVIVPRHPERFDLVYQQASVRGFNVVRRSQAEALTADTQVWLIDTLGELLAFYAIADVCTVAGSFTDIGGHNPLEPALFAKATVVGPDMANFKEICQNLLAADAIIQLNDKEELTAKVAWLLSKANIAQQLGKAAHGVVLDNQGASISTLTYINKLLQ